MNTHMTRYLRRCAITAAGAFLLVLAAAPLHGQLLDGDGDLEGLDLDELFDEEPDFELLARSHYSEVAHWSGVAPIKDADIDEASPPAWQVAHEKGYSRFAAVMGTDPFPSRDFARPLSGEPISTRVAVPEDGDYRVWVGYVSRPHERRPVTLELANAADRLSHTYGDLAVPQRERQEVESELPVRFESDADAARFGFSGDKGVLWEYWDTPLKKGVTVLSLRSESKEARVAGVFLSRSKAFTPSRAMYRPGAKENVATLNRVYYRFRVAEAGTPARQIKVTSFVRYSSPHYRRGSDKRIWYSAFMPSSTQPFRESDKRPLLSVGKWSQWVDETEVVTSRGRYGVCRLTVEGADAGMIEAQMAWYPHEAAVTRTIEIPVAAGKTLFIFPVHGQGYPPPAAADDDADAPWGVMDSTHAQNLESEGDALRRVIALMDTEEIVECPPLKRIQIFTGCGVSPAWHDHAVPALTRLGVNWPARLPLAVRRKYDVTERRVLYQQGSVVHTRNHCPLDPTFETWAEEWAETTAAELERDDPDIRTRANYLKMGDEIGPISRPAFINGLPDCRAAFHEYLRERLREAGEDASFFGVDDVTQLDYSLERSPDMGRFERRLYYHSSQFEWILTSRYYERFTRAVQKVFPNILTGCNHTPGSFMFGGDMRSSNWFSLARHGGSNTALAEGWVRTRGRYGFGGTQTISYYAEILDCAARPSDLHKWFYLVGGTGQIARKLVSLAARDIHMIHLYDWGPAYLGGDSFSDRAEAYPQINRGARALAGAEDLIVDGDREPRRVALVYNRSHEVWQSGSLGLYVDRLFTFLALQHSHIPVDVILDTDLTAEDLARYGIVYLNGFNVPRRAVPAMREWVEAGGVLYGTAGSAMRDEYDDPIPETADLFGASQRVAGVSRGSWYYSQWWPIGLRTHTPIDTISVQASPLTPEITVGVVGVKALLTPTTGKTIATYADGSCAGVTQELGKGKTLLLGVNPGSLYCHNAPLDWEEPYTHAHPTNYTADRRGLIAMAAQQVIGPPKADYSEPLVEIALFEQPGRGIAVLMSDYSYDPGRDAVLSVRTDREIREVVSSMRGTLEWRREGDRIVIPAPVPDPVDVIALHFAE